MNWKTEPIDYDDLLQVTDNYVVHARGFTIGNDIWFDQYALRLGHHRYWNDVVRYEYNFPEWEPYTSWTLYSSQNIRQNTVYWSIVGSGLIVIQYPRLRSMGEHCYELAVKTLEAMNVPDNTEVRFENIEPDQDKGATSHAQSILQPNNRLQSEQVEYGELDGLGTLKWI